MKKLLLIGLAVTAFVVTSSAQVAHRAYRLIPSDIGSLVVTNVAQITNRLTSGASTTNGAATSYTNLSGVRVVLNNSTKNLLQDAPLWSLRDGSGAWSTGTTNGSITYNQSYATLNVTWVAGSGANSAVTFVAVPLYGMNPVTGRANETTASADEWTFSFTPTASATQTLITNVPSWRWPGASGLRIRRIVNGDTDAASSVAIQDLSLNGFVPTGP